jgi:hypothetical protein
MDLTLQTAASILNSIFSKQPPLCGIAGLLIKTRDTGIGLSASDVDLLFVPFQQADVSHLNVTVSQVNSIFRIHPLVGLVVPDWAYRFRGSLSN